MALCGRGNSHPHFRGVTPSLLEKLCEYEIGKGSLVQTSVILLHMSWIHNQPMQWMI